jgi:membrane protein YdbS with pleckstrin-like domain
MDNLSQPIRSDSTVNENLIVTEKEYPITTLWVFKAPIIIILINIITLIFGYYIPYLILAMLIMLIINPLTKKNFHYSLEQEILIVNQGILSKKQRNLPYGVIQHVFVRQDLFDRIFGLASLRIENASQGGGALSAGGMSSFRLSGGNTRRGDSWSRESIGASGNRVDIPGLKKQKAEELKNLILQKIKENPIEDSQSGL